MDNYTIQVFNKMFTDRGRPVDMSYLQYEHLGEDIITVYIKGLCMGCKHLNIIEAINSKIAKRIPLNEFLRPIAILLDRILFWNNQQVHFVYGKIKAVKASSAEEAAVKICWILLKCNPWDDRITAQRMAISQDCYDKRDQLLPMIIAEGDYKVFQVVQELAKTATEHLSKAGFLIRNRGASGPLEEMVEQLDCMGIRGYQVLDALEYACGDYRKLMNSVENHDYDMIAYVNNKSAQAFKMDTRDFLSRPNYYIAVIKRSSRPMIDTSPDSANYIMTELNVNDYIIPETVKSEVNAQCSDIVDNMSAEEAIKIAEDQGFKVVYRKPVIDGNDDDVNECIILTHPERWDVIVAPCVTKTDFCCGGCNLYGVMRTLSKEEFMNTKVKMHNSRVIDGTGFSKFMLDYRDGFFCEYNKIKPVSYLDIPIWDVPIEGYTALPLPQFYSEHAYLFTQSQTVSKDSAFQIESMDLYAIINLLNLFELRKQYDNLSPEMQLLYTRYMQDFYETVIYYCNFIQLRPGNSINLLRFVSAVQELTEEDVTKIHEAAKKVCETVHVRNNHLTKEKALEIFVSADLKPSAMGRFLSGIVGLAPKLTVADIPDEFESWCKSVEPEHMKDYPLIEKYVILEDVYKKR